MVEYADSGHWAVKRSTKHIALVATALACLWAPSLPAFSCFTPTRDHFDDFDVIFVGRAVKMGPAPAPMERRAGRSRAQLLLQSGTRVGLHRLLNQWLHQVEHVPAARRVRWSLDVDPQELT